MESAFLCNDDDVDEGVEISHGTNQVSCRPGKRNVWRGLRGRPGVIKGFYQFEVVVVGNSLLRVGWSTASACLNLGTDSHSFGYGGTAMKSHARHFEKYGDEFHGKDGTVITCLLDRRSLEKQTISYRIDGEDLGVAFELPESLAGVPLFPGLCGRENWDAQLSFSECRFPMTDCLPLADGLQHDADAVAKQVVSGLCSGDADAGVEVSEGGMKVIGRQPDGKWLGVRGRPGVLKGAYQFDVELHNEGLIRVGWATLTSKRNLGRDAKSFGYGGTAKKSHAGKYDDYGEMFQDKPGSIVSCLIDRTDPENQTISYCFNGQPLGVAFTIPAELAEEPLFPAICGKATWIASCRCSAPLLKPCSGFIPVGESLLRGDAIQGPEGELKAPEGKAVTSRDHEDVLPGRKVVLSVNSGPWSGWYVCKVLDTDDLGCYLEHEQDGFKESVPWTYLGGPKFSMDLLPEDGNGCQAQTVSWQLEQEKSAELGVDLEQTSATGFLRRCSLKVDPIAGAGLELSTCDAGYLVDAIDVVPGQANLRRGFAIVAIGGHLLLGLEPEEVERRFGAAVCDGAEVIAGPAHGLLTQPFDSIRLQALQLMSPKANVSLSLQEPELVRVCSLPPTAQKRVTDNLLRKTTLRVTSDGAGLELETCEHGYLVTAVESQPGQPGLTIGEAIIGIGGTLLLGCSSEEVEELFGAAFKNGAALITGLRRDLAREPMTSIRAAAEHLMAASLGRSKTV